MRWMTLPVVLASILGGCGGDDEGNLDGDWVAMANNACVIAMEIKSNPGTYNWAFVCGLEGGGFGADLESGDIDLSMPGKMAFRPRKGSCPTTDHSPVTVTYSRSDDKHLALTFPNSVVQFERSTEEDATGVIRLGCWTRSPDLLFTDSPFVDL